MHASKAKHRPTSDFVPKKARRAVVLGTTKAGKLGKLCTGGKEQKMATVFRHIGSMIECDGNTDHDVDTRLAVASSMFNQLHPLMKSTTLSTKAKLKIFRVTVRWHGSEVRVGSLGAQRGDA